MRTTRLRLCKRVSLSRIQPFMEFPYELLCRFDSGKCSPIPKLRFAYSLRQQFAEKLCLQFVFVPQASVEHVIRPSQLQLSSLQERAIRGGRGSARLLSAPREFPQLFGAPRFLWRKYVEATLQVWRSRLWGGSDRDRAIAEITRGWTSGQILEYRRLNSCVPQSGDTRTTN